MSTSSATWSKRVLLSVRGSLLPIITITILLLLWEGVVQVGDFPSYILPPPSGIVVTSVEWFPTLMEHTLVTLRETLIGFAGAILVALPMAVLVVQWPALRRSVYPILLLLQSVPKVALAPILLVWLGFGQAPKIVIALLASFFPLFLDSVAGFESTPRDHLDLVRSLQANPLQTFLKVRFPHALPHIFVGLKVGVTFAVIGAVVGEFVQSSTGLGYLILVSSTQLNTALSFAAMILLAVISIVLFYIVEGLEHVFLPWAEHRAHHE